MVDNYKFASGGAFENISSKSSISTKDVSVNQTKLEKYNRLKKMGVIK